jgi:hypothetical protein
MIIDTYSPEVSSSTAVPPDLYPQPEMERSHSHDNLESILDDETIIWRFARGKKRLVANHNLRIDYAHNSLQLSTPSNELIAIHKIAEKLHYVLIKKDSKYSKMIQDIIAECQFVPIDAATAERGFVRYQKYEIPPGYKLRYESADALWETWQNDRQHSTIGLQLDILILARSKWYRVQQMICTDDRLDLQTRLGLISLSRRDRIAWIAKLGDIPIPPDVDLVAYQNTPSGGGDSDILGKIISKLAIEVSANQDLYLDSNSTMSESALLYDEDRSSTLTSHILNPISAELRASVLDVLEDYLAHGETIVRTETIADAQGNTISEKTVSTHRGCPRWAIEAIIGWS